MLQMKIRSPRKKMILASKFMAISLSLLFLLNSFGLASGDSYPNNKTQFILINSATTRVSWSNSSQNFYCAAWEVNPKVGNPYIQFGIINKSVLASGQELPFFYRKNVSIPLTPFLQNFDSIQDPSIAYLDDGTILLVLIMHDPFYLAHGVYEIRSTDQGATWTTPYCLSNDIVFLVQNLRLIALNQTTFVAIWEEKAESTSNITLVYRILPDIGSAWQPRHVLWEHIKGFNYCYRTDGSITIMTYFSISNESTIRLEFPYAFELTRNSTEWKNATPILLNNETGGVSTFYNILTFDDDTYLYSSGNNVFFFQKSSNRTSPAITMQFDSSSSDLTYMFKISASSFIVFFIDNGNTYYLYADNFRWQEKRNPDPVWIFVIVISIIIGGQIILFSIHKKRKQQQSPAVVRRDDSSTAKKADTDQVEKNKPSKSLPGPRTSSETKEGSKKSSQREEI